MSSRWKYLSGVALMSVALWTASPARASCAPHCFIAAITGSGFHVGGEFDWAGSVTGVELTASGAALKTYLFTAHGTFGGLSGEGKMALSSTEIPSFEFTMSGNPRMWVLTSGTSWIGTYTNSGGTEYVGTLALVGPV